MERLHVEIDSVESLLLAGDTLHDASFLLEDMLYDRDRQVFRLASWREATETPARRHPLLWVLSTGPYARVPTLLELRGVLAMEVAHEYPKGSCKGSCIVDRFRFDTESSTLTITGHPNLRIRLQLGNIDGCFEDTGDPTWDPPPWML